MCVCVCVCVSVGVCGCVLFFCLSFYVTKYHSARGNLLPSLHVLVVSISNEPSFISNIPKTGQRAWALSEYKDEHKYKQIHLLIFLFVCTSREALPGTIHCSMNSP